MELMSSDYSYMYTRAQPNNALVLKPTIYINGQTESLVNLPRLTHSFYYNIETTHNDITLQTQPYPCLIFSKPAFKDDIQLTICSADTNDTIATIKISIDATFNTSREELKNSLDFSKIDSDDILSFDAETTYYNPVLHNYGLVTDEHLYLTPSTSSLNTWLNAELSISDGALISNTDNNTVDMMEYAGTLKAHTVKYKYSYANPTVDVDFNSILASELTPTSDIVAWFSDNSITRTNTNTYTQDTTSSTRGNYWLACNDTLIIADVSHTETLTDTQLKMRESLIGESIPSLTGSSVDLTQLNDYHVTFQDVTTRELIGNTLQVNAKDSDYVFNGIGFYGGISPACIAISPKESYTLHFDTDDDDLVCMVGDTPALPTPSKAYFTFDGWYIDKELTTPFDYTKHGIANATINLYAKWVYSGGYYTVRFIDTYNNTSESITVKTIEQPELPANPERVGYGFSHWLIVESASDTTGTKYSPETFAPSSDYTYIFSAQYAVEGIITKIENSTATYYVGQSLDKSKLKVTVQTDDSGTTKVLNSSEFTVSPSTFSASGKKTLTVTYTATGATATTDVTVLEDSITSISASYNGGVLAVGNNISTSDIKVTAKYASGSEAVIKGFSIYPTTVRSVGVNTITVTYGSVSTTVNVSGASATTSTNSRKLTALSATYNGKDVYIGDTLLSSNFTVTATYSDGYKEVLSSSKFSFTPNYMSKAGSNTVVISYGGLSCQTTVYVKERNTTTTTGTPTSNKGSTSGTTNTSTPTSSTPTKGSTPTRDKTTSVGYLNGSNILTMLMSNPNDTAAVNTVDITAILEDASNSAEIPITLINLAGDSALSEDDIKLIRKKALHLNISMKDADTDEIIGIWNIDGESLSTEASALNLSIYQSEVPKASETMYVLYVDDITYTEGINCRVYLTDAFPQGEYVSLYKCDTQLADSFCITKFLWEADNISLPLEHAPNYVITNNRMNYANGSDLTQELINDVIEDETVVEETEEAPVIEETSVNIEDAEVTEPEFTSNKNSSNKALVFILIAAVIIIITLVLVFIQYINYRGKEEEFLEESDEDIEYFEE